MYFLKCFVLFLWKTFLLFLIRKHRRWRSSMWWNRIWDILKISATISWGSPDSPTIWILLFVNKNFEIWEAQVRRFGSIWPRLRSGVIGADTDRSGQMERESFPAQSLRSAHRLHLRRDSRSTHQPKEERNHTWSYQVIPQLSAEICKNTLKPSI